MFELTADKAFPGLRPVGSGAGVIAAERCDLSIVSLLAKPKRMAALAGRVADLLAIDLLDGPRYAQSATATVIGIGTGKWLIVSKSDAACANRLAGLLNGLASVVDQSGAYGVLRLSGPRLLAVLEKGVQIDMSSAVFSPGSVAVTTIGSIGAVLWKVDESPTFDVGIPRSLAGSFLHWLESSAGLHGLAIQPSAAGKLSSETNISTERT